MKFGPHEHVRRGQTPNDDWQTPAWVVKPLGHFDLDPCASTDQHHRTADTLWTVNDNGFLRQWAGRVWLNPPYGNKTVQWVRRLADHGNGIALVYARTDTPLFQEVIFVRATGLFFLKQRIFFIQRDGNPAPSSGGAPSVLVAFGEANMRALQLCGLKGMLVDLRLEGVTTRYAKPVREEQIWQSRSKGHLTKKVGAVYVSALIAKSPLRRPR